MEEARINLRTGRRAGRAADARGGESTDTVAGLPTDARATSDRRPEGATRPRHQAAGFTVASERDVLVAHLPDRPGALAAASRSSPPSASTSLRVHPARRAGRRRSFRGARRTGRRTPRREGLIGNRTTCPASSSIRHGGCHDLFQRAPWVRSRGRARSALVLAANNRRQAAASSAARPGPPRRVGRAPGRRVVRASR